MRHVDCCEAESVVFLTAPYDSVFILSAQPDLSLSNGNYKVKGERAVEKTELTPFSINWLGRLHFRILDFINTMHRDTYKNERKTHFTNLHKKRILTAAMEFNYLNEIEIKYIFP